MSSISPDIRPMERLVIQNFAEVFRQYVESSDEVQAVIRDMCEIVNDPETDGDERAAAIDTLYEALFPTTHDGELGIDIVNLRKEGVESSSEVENAFTESDDEERTFAQRLRSILESRGMTQDELAIKVGVQQPAISMMLNRQCRPQRRTVNKIADALGVSPADLWPA